LGWDTGYHLYYSLTYSLKWKFFGLETCTGPHYLVLNFYQINEDSEIRTCDCLVIKTLILYQKTISIQKLKLLNKISGYVLYYSSTYYRTEEIFFFVAATCTDNALSIYPIQSLTATYSSEWLWLPTTNQIHLNSSHPMIDWNEKGDDTLKG
jgi:hypothetical protein